ncbi:hypothetical protein JBL43_06100 [Aureibaculum sp. A20]|uniref:DUF4258 domain-containing protein n=1 Tax=Aureibaculum flavum TaxID=2795986 RepID=A0ABS0WPA9_9FLAO|nr:hypothetical protein [Aureibaculum flavum]MBJ2173802.1 hypothetical protein [Aureibaculum flavum]
MKKLTKTGIIILVLIAAIVSVYGFIDGYQDAKDRSELISEVLEENCNCSEINQIIYAKGLQFGKEGMSTEKAEYQMIDCDYQSFEVEAIRINDVLNKKVKGFKDFDLLTIEINNKINSETLTIKNGVIQ